jgi:phenylpyruvate tautomerase PptA (4-oxalocrotonate tautomerase family)
MPIVDVEMVCESESEIEGVSPSDLAQALGLLFGSPPANVWVRLRYLSSRHYAENEMPVGPGELPVFVTVLHAHSPTSDARSVEMMAVTEVVAELLARSKERVHVQYAPDAAGRQAFGGHMVS